MNPTEKLTDVLADFGVNRAKTADKTIKFNLYITEDEKKQVETSVPQISVFNGDLSSPYEKIDIRAATTVKDVVTKAKIHFKCDFQSKYSLYSTITSILLLIRFVSRS